MPGFRQQYKKQKKDLLKRHEESVANKDSTQFGSIIDNTKLPKGMGFWKCSFADHVIDYIPFIAGPNMPKLFENDKKKAIKEGEFIWAVDLWTHGHVGVLEHPYVCPAKTNGDPCPICEHLQQERNTYTEEEYKRTSATRQTLHLIWCHDNSEEEAKGVQLWQIAHYFMEKNLKVISEKPKGGGTISYFDPDVGKNVAFTKQGSGSKWKFIGHRFGDRDEPIPDKILDQSFSLDSVVKNASYDEIYDAFHGAKHDGGSVGDTDVVGPAPFEQEPTQTEPESGAEQEFAPDECPIGGEFGADHDVFEQCTEGGGCVNWDNCFAVNQEMQEPDPEPDPESEPATQRAQLRTPKAEKATPTKGPIRRRRS